MQNRFESRRRLTVLIAATLSATVRPVHADLTFLNVWGSLGSSNTQLNTPAGVAVDPAGNVYVADSGNNRVQEFNSTGTYLSTPTAISPSSFNSPEGVAFSPDGSTLYIAGTGPSSLFALSGGAIQSAYTGHAGFGVGQLAGPYGIAVAQNGTVFVIDTNGNRVDTFTPFLTYVSTFGTGGSATGQFNQPLAGTIAPNGNLYVSDQNNDRIQIFSPSGVYQSSLGTQTTNAGTKSDLHFPYGVAVSSNGITYVADGLDSRIVVFDSTGTYASSIGSLGTGNAQFNYAGGIAVTPTGMVYATDYFGGRVERYFDPNAWTSGTNSFTNAATGPTTVTVGTGQMLGAVFNVSSVMALNATTISVNPSGTLTLAGQSSATTFNNIGTTVLEALSIDTTFNNTGTLVLNGGTLLAAGTNSGLVKGYGGFAGLSGSFVNSGTFDLSGGILSYGNTSNFNNAAGAIVSLPADYQFQISTSASFLNYGTLNLNNSAITTTGGTLQNNLGGYISGAGSIFTAFTNSGTVSLDSGVMHFNNTVNNLAGGQILLNGPSAQINGITTLTNAQAIQGKGTLIAGTISNSGTIEAVGGTLTVAGAITNNAPGVLVASAGSELFFPNGIASNLGLISLTGGTLDTGSSNISNGGQVVGYGTIRTGTLTNNAILTLTGGTTTFNGTLNNSAGKTVNVKYQPAIFTGAVQNSGTFKITGTTVTFTGTYTGNAYISDPSDNIFQNNVTIIPGGTMTGGTGDRFFFYTGTITNNGTFNNAGVLQSSDNATNAGTFVQSGAQSWSAGTTFTNTAGAATFNSDTGAGGADLSVNVNGGTVAFASTQHLAGLSIAAGSIVTVTGGGTGSRSVVVTPQLSVAGTLNLTSNDLDVQGGSLSAMTVSTKLGYNNGGWNGSIGITSSTAAADGKHLTAIGVIQNNQNGTALYTSSNPFGQITPGASDILVSYTYYGDANLSGKVDSADYTLIDAAYLADRPNPTAYTGWFNGDFNYDSVVNGSDYTLIDNAFNTQGAQLVAQIATAAAQIAGSSPGSAAALGASAVPEPASLVLAGIGTIGLLSRRKRAQ